MLVYVGIAEVTGAPGFTLSVHENPDFESPILTRLPVGGYVPHFRATDNHDWLEVTLHSGETGWMPFDREHVTVVLPDPTRLRVCLDPGHGGEDAGARAFGLEEKEINFDITYNKLYPMLQADNRIERIWVTRNGDYDVDLRYRWDLANASFAALFVSIHTNASANPEVRGTEDYFKCGEEGTARINSISRRAGCLIHQRLRQQIEQFGSPNCPWEDLGVVCRLFSEEDERSYYFVLQNSNVPSVLVETMYMTNPGEARCLANDTFREFVAEGIYQGITETLFTQLPGTACDFRRVYGI